MAPDESSDESDESEPSHGASGPAEDEPVADDVDERLRSLHDHLAATAELPVETEASRWLGEAEAVAADVAGGDAPPGAIETRVRQVEELLSHVEGTGNPEADEHVSAACDLVAALRVDVTKEP